MPFITQNMITRLFVCCWYAKITATASGDIEDGGTRNNCKLI